MEHSTIVQFSSPFLEQKYRAHNQNTNVFMDPTLGCSSQIKNRTPLRLGWVGSGGHVLDAQGLSRFLSQCPALQNFLFQ